MKILFTILFSIVSLKGCTQKTVVQDAKANEQQTEMKIEYQAISRGFFYKTALVKGTISVQKTRNDVDVKKGVCPEKDWKDTTNTIETIELETINSLKPPSTKSHYDGAAIANITITIGDKTYTSSSFDHGNPPAELKPLVDKILALAETVENP